MPFERPPSDDTEALVFDLLTQILQDQDEGGIQPLAHYLARFPGHDALVASEYLAVVAGRSNKDDPCTPVGPGDSADRGGAGESRTKDMHRVGPFEILGTLGRGGQGVVHLARDSRLARRVALKVLELPQGILTTQRLERFRREAEALGRLDHPGICTVLEARLDAAPPYLAMRFVAGAPLTRWIATATWVGQEEHCPLPLPPRNPGEIHRVLRFFEEAARALHSAHEAGVLHRDVKPGNIMVTPEGHPVLLDFGLARIEEASQASLTRSGEVFGTPAYMSPEQLRGSQEPDRRTDVYSLAAVLYECLTLRRPFESDSVEGLFRAIDGDDPADPRALNPAVPRDLAVVLEVALEKTLSRRYASALEFAEDLGRIREHRPILARPAGAGLRFRRLLQRHPVAAIALSGTLLVLLSALLLSLFFLGRTRESLRLQNALILAHEAERLIEQDPSLALSLAVEAATRGGGKDAASFHRVLLRALEGCPQQWSVQLAGDQEAVDVDTARGWVACMDGVATVSLRSLEDGSEIASASAPRGRHFLELSPAGDRLVTWTRSGALQLWQLPELTPLLPEERPGVGLADAGFSPDGSLVHAARVDGEIVLRSAASGSLVRSLEAHDGPVRGACWASDGSLFLSWSGRGYEDVTEEPDGTARVWNPATWEPVQILGGHCSPIWFGAFSPDLRHVVTATEDGVVRLWDHMPGSVIWRSDLPGRAITARFSPDGARIAVVWEGRGLDVRPGIAVLDAATGKTIRAIGSPSWEPFVDARWSPDGSYLGGSCRDGTLRIWNPESPEPRWVLHQKVRFAGQRSWCWLPVTHGRGGPQLVSVNGNRTTLWNLEGTATRLLDHQGAPVWQAVFHRGGSLVLTACQDGSARVWDRASGRELSRLEHGGVPVLTARFVPGPGDEDRVLTTLESGEIDLWDWKSRARLLALEGHTGPVFHVELTADGSRLLTLSSDGTGRLWDLADGRCTAVLAGHTGPILCGALGPDGRWVATGGWDGTVRIWECATGAQLHVLADQDPDYVESKKRAPRVLGITFSLQRDLLFVSCEDRFLRVYDCAGLPPRLQQERILGPRTPGQILVDQAGTHGVALDAWNNGLTVFSQHPLAPVRLLRGASRVLSAAMDPSERVVAVACSDGSVRAWSLLSGELQFQETRHRGPVAQVAFSPDGEWIVSASLDGTAWILPVHPLEVARRIVPRELAPSEREKYARLLD